jgi:hypothetical protein
MAAKEETNAEKFIRLKDARLGKVLDALRILKNVTNVRDYDYTPEQAQEVVDTIQTDVDDLSDGFGLPPRSLSEPRTTPETPTVDAIDLSGDEDASPSADWNDKANMDPYGVKSNITEIDGKKIKVAPGDWDGLMLIRVGPHLGLAYEAALDGDSETAAELLRKVMTA